MKQLTPEIICSLGIAVLAGGALLFIYGVETMAYRSFLNFWGVLTTPQNLCFFGSIFAVIGAGVTSFGFLLIRARKRV